MTQQKTSNDDIQIKVWIHRGTMNYNAYCLDSDDPDSVYQQIITQGGKPEDYGIKHSKTEKYEKYSRQELIEIIERQYKELLYRNGAYIRD